MGLSRLDNLLKNARGTILYVDPANIDSTDSIENQGNSPTRPFKTIQRALMEASRFSYQGGKRNDRFNKTSIMLYPGDHIVDNRPGWIPDGAGVFKLRSSATSTELSEFDLGTNLDLTTSDNNLYKLNSIHGGVIVPRGTSIIGMDLRKTKIRPTYVPNPENDAIERSAVFRITGGSYFWQFSILDSDPNDNCYKDYTTNIFVPNFSHHKLTAFEYVDGVNPVNIDDGILSYSTTRTDLDMYYEKIGIVYGETSGREIPNDYPSSSIDIEKRVDEYRIVGEKSFNIGISSIRSGDGSLNPSTTITVTLDQEVDNLSIDTPINIRGINTPGYEGRYVVSDVIDGSTIQYKVLNIPINVNPSPTLIQDASLNIEVDSVTSTSPYIFNVSLRSVYGMCGLLADGDKVTGFKSMVVAQFTGIGLQKDDNAFVVYDSVNREYLDSTKVDNLHTNPEAKYKPEYRNFHIKAVNDAYIQVVSVFAIGYAEHFVCENGGDQSINNSNSNFGAKALVARGFKRNAYDKDNSGYITHIIPPKELETEEQTVEFLSIDVDKTYNAYAPGFGYTSRLYLYNEKNIDFPPSTIIDGYRIGSKIDDRLSIVLNEGGVSNEYSAIIIMQNTEYNEELTSEKSYEVLRINNNSENAIDANNIITFTSPHSFLNGESVRVISENGDLPDGVRNNEIYHVITGVGIGTTQIKLAQTLQDSLSFPPTELKLNSRGGVLKVVSRVSDKKTGDIGHPVQWDEGNSQWYVTVGTSSSSRNLYDRIVNLGTQFLGEATPRSFIKRTPDTRNTTDTVYKLRYVIPKDSPVSARPPLDGFVLQESSSGIGTGSGEVEKYFNQNSLELINSNELRNFRFITTCTYNSTTGIASVTTEVPHNLTIGSQVEVVNVRSTNNTTGTSNLGYNGTFDIVEINNSKEFSYSLNQNPGTFTNDINSRDENLPRFSRKKYSDTFVVYRTKEVQKFIPGSKGQDGIYHLLVVNSSNSPTVTPFREENFYQPIQNLYPQLNRDNPKSDPEESNSHALSNVIGQVVIDEPQNSLTKESLTKLFYDANIGFGITDIQSDSSGIAHTIFTRLDHNLNGITKLSIVDGGSGYSNGTYYDVSLTGSQTGKYATAKVTVSGGEVTDVSIIHPGSSYYVGNELSISINGNSSASFIVDEIYDHTGETLSISGIAGTFRTYNNLYRISGITTGKEKEIQVISASAISNTSTSTILSNPLNVLNFNTSFGQLTGKSLVINSFDYTPSLGIATIGFTTSHGLKIDSKLKIGLTNNNNFNTDILVKRINSITEIVARIGIVTTATTISIGGSEYVHPYSLTSFGGDILNDKEKTSGRLVSIYDGVSSIITQDLVSTEPDPQVLIIKNAVEIGLKIGDYLQIQDEIFRIKSPVTSDSVSVFRSLIGSPRQSHYVGYVVRKIKPLPVELRKNSIIRASSHTFEYLGYGPGNYSTAFPERQTRQITSQEELLSQSTKYDGGLIVFTGMNNDGDFYVGNKKVSSATGQEEVFDTPIPTVTGEDPGVGGVSVGFDVLTPLEASISRSIRVEGGPDANVISEFDGPVIFNNKITSTSTKGIEANSFYAQGNASVSRKFTVGTSKPTLAGNPGDIVTNAEPYGVGDYIGWTYSLENEWIPFGILGGNGVGISSNGTNIGFTTSINIVGDGIDVSIDNNVGYTTFKLTSKPRIGLSTGVLNTYSGIATQLNFVGYGITVSTVYNQSSGIATVYLDGTAGLIDLIGTGTTEFPGGPIKSIQYNKDGFQWGGLTGSQYNDNTNVLTLTSKLNYNLNTSSTAINIVQSGTGDVLLLEDRTSDTTPFILKKSGSVGIGISNPTARLHVSTNESPGVLIESTSGSSSNNPLEVRDSANDVTPFIVNYQGNVGINTRTLFTGVALDVLGNTTISGELRIYESDRSNYVGLRCPSIASNLTFTLPSSYGNSGQVLTSNGSGILSWRNVSNQEVAAGTGIRIQYTTVGTGLTIAQIFNTGIRNITAGTGVVVTNTAEGEVTISAVVDPSPYPFTTIGFSYVLGM